MAMRLLKLGVLKGFFQRVLPQESAQLIIRPVCIEHPGAICEGREAPVGDCASSAHVDTRSGSEYDARQAAEQVAEPSASNVFASGVLSAVYADSVFRLAANRTIQSWNLPPHALMSKTRLSDCLHSGSAGRSPGTALPRTFHTASPLQRTGRSQLQGALQAQCQSFHDCDLSQSSRGHFEVTRSFATKAKKYKIKSYSSYKQRFWSMPGGGFKRMKAGKRHNASAKTKKQLRRLRTPTTTPPALAKVMRQLGFQGR